jgi:hypothetical protein
MKRSELKQIIREEIQKVFEEDNLEGYSEEIKSIGSKKGTKLNMHKVFKILRAAGYEPRITQGNKIFPKEITVWGKGREVEYGGMQITPNGELFGDDLWGVDIKNEEQVIPALQMYINDQRGLWRKERDIEKLSPGEEYAHDLP